jgi:thioredoxin reductase
VVSSVDTAIVGAGPYGLSIAAHLRAIGMEHRVIGEPMSFWLRHMPKGMLLKSDGFSSALYDPGGEFTLKRYCKERGIVYADLGIPVRLEVFCAYGLAFQERFVPHLENEKLISLEQARTGFTLHLNSGEIFLAKKVVIATGLTHFERIPPQLAVLPKGLVSHSSAHVDLDQFKGRDITVVGGGASATELATLLHEAGSNVRVVVRQPSVDLQSRMQLPRPLAQKIRRPMSPVGPGLRSRFFTDLPLVFHHLPEPIQNRLVKGFLGPAGGWFLRGRFDRVPLLAGYQIKGADVSDGRAILRISSQNGDERRIETDHVIAATGFRPEVGRLAFLSKGIKAQLKLLNQTPKLSSHFESSVPGLFFVGPATVNSFGPVVRFAAGARFTALRLSNYLARTSRVANRENRGRDIPRPLSATDIPGAQKERCRN